MRRRLISILMIVLMGVATLQPAHAFFGFGGVVFDPTNYGQNLLTAARTLQTVNNQIQQLQNEADMIVNQVKDLTKLDFDSRQHLSKLLQEISTLTDQAKAMSFEVQKADQVFKTKYPEDYANLSSQQIIQNAESLWKTSRSSLHDALLMQSKIAETVRADTSVLDTLMRESQGAGGNLAAAQAGNQILALSAKQTMQLQELTASQFRAETLERARRLQIERAAKVRHSRFVGGSSAYSRN